MTLGRETSPLSTDSSRRGIEVVPPAIACQESFAVFARCKTERSNELTTGVESFRCRRRRPKLRSGRQKFSAALLRLKLSGISAAAPLIAPYGPLTQKIVERLQPPSPAHPFGTDPLGRDVLSRILYGGRISLPVGFLVVSVSLVIGGAMPASRADWSCPSRRTSTSTPRAPWAPPSRTS